MLLVASFLYRVGDAGTTAEIGGDALSTPASDTALIFSLIAAAVILLIAFGALAAAGMPLLTAIVGVGLSLFGIIALSSTLGLSSTSQELALTKMGLAAAATIAGGAARLDAQGHPHSGPQRDSRRAGEAEAEHGQ